jgi:hypothetical protein
MVKKFYKKMLNLSFKSSPVKSITQSAVEKKKILDLTINSGDFNDL